MLRSTIDYLATEGLESYSVPPAGKAMIDTRVPKAACAHVLGMPIRTVLQREGDVIAPCEPEGWDNRAAKQLVKHPESKLIV
jgi:hypothetical protein